MTKARAAQRKGGSHLPVSAHPVFPVIVALWFAALFGIGILVLPGILIERAVDATGLAAIVPSAAPPLGFSARLMLAAGAGMVGALGGLLIARKVVAAQSSPRSAPRAGTFGRTADIPPAKRPIIATEELGEEGLGSADDSRDVDSSDHSPAQPAQQPLLPGRRRALSVTDDSGPSEFLFQVPLPGSSAEPAADIAVPDHAAQDDAAEAAQVQEHLPPDATEMTGQNQRPFDAPIAFPGFSLIGADDPENPDNPQGTAPGEPGADHLPAAGPEETPMPASETASARPFPPALPERQIFGEPQGGQFAAIPALPADATLAELPISDLIARFAQAMQGQTAASGAPGTGNDIGLLDEPGAEPGIAEADADSGADQSAEQAVPFAFSRSQEAAPVEAAAAATGLPEALRPLDLAAFEENDEEDDDPFFDMGGIAFGAAERSFAPPTLSAASFAEPAPTAPAEDGDTGDNEGYSSLLSMKAPLGGQREFIRIDEDDDTAGNAQPAQAVIFPGQAGDRPDGTVRPFDAPASRPASGGNNRMPAAMPSQRAIDPVETERALRDALEKLQRMSGAA